MQITTHFQLSEFVASAKAKALGIDNTPPQEVVPRIILTAEMLERIRSEFGMPITVTSGYRCPELNAAVGSRTTSDHTTGRAADFVCPRFGSPYVVAKTLSSMVDDLDIGQLIYERIGSKAWVHVSTVKPSKPLNRVITICDKGTLLGIHDA